MARSLPEWQGATDDTEVPERVRIRVWQRDGGRCQCCTRKIMAGERWVCDHTIALINGGENRESNLRVLCDWCDRKVKTPADVREKAKVARMARKHIAPRRRSTLTHPTKKRRIDGVVVDRQTGESVTRYRKKPVVIEAVRWDGNLETVEPLLAKSSLTEVQQDLIEPDLLITTLEGEMCARIGDWIILGVAGELYPCKPDIFEATYELAEDA